MDDLSSPNSGREALLRALTDAGRENSTATVMFHTALAHHFGLSPTEWKCGELIHRFPDGLTAGQLARRTGLTTGAITGIVDRLEKVGFARRVADPNDRRRVIVRPSPDRLAEASQVFESFLDGWREALAGYSDEELAFLLEYTKRVTALVEREAAKLNAASVSMHRNAEQRLSQSAENV
ncbi:MAG: MarR family transcriptional regulator [Anaerolineae bacterium]